jgi:hypothetical protein
MSVAACDPSAEKVQALQARVDALEARLDAEAEAAGKRPDPVPPLQAEVRQLADSLEGTKTDVDALTTKVDVVATELTLVQADVAKIRGAGSGPTPEVVGEIGVAECDAYVANYRKCIDDELPLAAQDSAKKALEMSVDAWKAAAKTAAGREALAGACKTASDAVAPLCDP